MRRLLPALIASASLFTACASSAPDGSVESVGQTSAPIINGIASDATEDYVVLVVFQNKFETSECSGTLLAPNLVLTARHCVSQTDESVACASTGIATSGGTISGDNPTNEIFIFTGATRPDFSKPVVPAATATQLFHDDANNLCNHDLALILLNQSIPNAVIAPIRLDSKPRTGALITAIGWGLNEASQSPDTRLQRAGVSVLAVGPVDPDLPANELVVGESICQGDSGGPAIDPDTGAVVGVVSRGGNGQKESQTAPANTCIGNETQNVYTIPTGFADTINAAYAVAGATPWLEGKPNPNLAADGAACAQPTDCQSNNCTNAVCVEDCTVEGCATGQTCGANKLCAAKPPTTTVKSGCGCSTPGEKTDHGALAAIAFASLLFAAGVRRRRHQTS